MHLCQKSPSRNIIFRIRDSFVWYLLPYYPLEEMGLTGLAQKLNNRCRFNATRRFFSWRGMKLLRWKKRILGTYHECMHTSLKVVFNPMKIVRKMHIKTLLIENNVWISHSHVHMHIHMYVLASDVICICMPNIPIWVNFRGASGYTYSKAIWYILRPFVIFYVRLVWFVLIWYIFSRFGMLYQVL
jgi:hypothetical protein